ncbi:Transmembrane protein 147 [Schistosoma japonicum]|uniref:BOS complex subunit TMEM147 n=3 Tax=Schistosoma japonicum TaxID=6182 RepID=C1LLC7_SCHJA|nr:Transmembrane protein 147 [Schistosoma japonicum]CAX75504.1 Transmembrane protein 147 [Schistosoma japonicum]CAX75505.1 Transmembrane protein 147 [Schistosoma japonicum]
MGLFHLANCLALATGPHLLVYKSTGIRENDALWPCCKMACLYALTQMLKFFLVTLAPHNYLSKSDSATFDAFGILLEIIIITLIVRRPLFRSEFNVVASSVGWSIASLIATKYVPIWVGTRGLEFDWRYLCLSYEANLDLVDTFVMFYAVWLLSRRSGPVWSTLMGLFIISMAPLKSILFSLLSLKIENIFTMLAMKTIICIVFGFITIVLRSQRHTDRNDVEKSQGLSTIIRLLYQLTAGRYPCTYKSRDSKSNSSIFLKNVK